MAETKPTKQAAPAGLALRQAAAKLLAAVVDKKNSLDGLLDKTGGAKPYLALAERDQALLRAMLLTALRRRGALAARLAGLLQKPLPSGARALEHILHIGAAQILYLDIPNHAAIDLAVESAKRNPQTARFAALVNAVLRRLARQEEAGAAAPKAENAADASAPPWFWQMLAADYGAEKAALIIKAQALPPPLDITVKENPLKWAERLQAELTPFGNLRLSGEKIAVPELPGFAEGAWWVQNSAASLPARLLGAVKGLRVADLCAAPGGKTAQLAAAGAEVTAVDISAVRLRRLQDNLRRLGLKAEIWQGDLRKLSMQAGWPAAAAKEEAPAGFRPFDAALLDAPCSSTGTARRHPDIVWTKTAADVAALARLQADLLAASLGLVKSGGIILFCNCSLAKAEGEDLPAAFLAAHQSEVKALPFAAAEIEALLCGAAARDKTLRAQAARLITEQGFLRTTPAEALFPGMDGFFAARLQKL